MITVTRHIDISCGHRLTGHPGKCANLHGHNYRISVTFSGPLNEDGMVVDFGDIKLYFDHWLKSNWDHRFLIWDRDPDYGLLKDIDPSGVVGVPFNPTAEAMAHYLMQNWDILLDDMRRDEKYCNEVQLTDVEVQETEKCSAFADGRHIATTAGFDKPVVTSSVRKKL